VLATDGAWHEADDAGQNEWRAAIAPALMASVVLVLAVAMFLVARRLSGAFAESLAPVPLIITAIGLLAWATAVRLRLGDRRVDWLLAMVLALFAFACSFPGNRAVDWVVWVTTFAAFALVPARRSSPAIGSESDKVAAVLQQLTRSRTAAGCETIRGTLVAEFAAGERTAILHIAFCPPFEQLPTVEAEVAKGPACDVKLAQILHQGARLEARLARASTSAERATIEFSASDRPA
jgi:hypothetical protein